jgi:hypothetical protein
MARSRYKIFNNQYPFYLTSTTVEWLPLFIDPDVVQIILHAEDILMILNTGVVQARGIMPERNG